MYEPNTITVENSGVKSLFLV